MSNINYTLATTIFKEWSLLEHPFSSNTDSDRLCYIAEYAVRIEYDIVSRLPLEVDGVGCVEAEVVDTGWILSRWVVYQE